MTKDPSVDSTESMVIDYINREVRPSPDMPPVGNDTALIETGIIDSLSMLKLVLFIEERFGITVPPEDVVPSNFETVRGICGYIRGKQESARGSATTT
jgi:acyl carrier protein